MSLSGKVGLVTGGAQGIGLAVVESLLKRSVKVSPSAERTDAQLGPAGSGAGGTHTQRPVSHSRGVVLTKHSVIGDGI